MRKWAVAVMTVVSLVGCNETVIMPLASRDQQRPEQIHQIAAEPTSAGTQFDLQNCGTITGRVIWRGPIPDVPPIPVERMSTDGTRVEHTLRPNPHAPKIDPQNRGTAGVVIYLRGVDVNAARPWDHPPVTIEMRDDQPLVRQGEGPPRLTGFVRRGDAVTMVSKQSKFHSIRARGAAFFTLTLPEPDWPRRRQLSNLGRVEFSSAAGNTAMRGHVFVDDHPYFTTTDVEGRFTIPSVPAGQYDLICWRPDWQIERRERDPETLLHVRLFFLSPKESSQNVRVSAQETSEVNFEIE